MAFHFVSSWQKIRESPRATHKIEKLSAMLTEKKVVMASCGDLIMRLRSLNFNVASLPFAAQFS
jgi:hypothetical protein